MSLRRAVAAGGSFLGRLASDRGQRSEMSSVGSVRQGFDFSSPWGWQERCTGELGVVCCNLCGWSGPAFAGAAHCEAATCPTCGSIARDRFLFHCFLTRTPPGSYRILETSPRLGGAYREAMRTWFEYRASDFDLRSHKADLFLDIQNIELEASSVDILLSPHVLEHVPDTDRALVEIHKVLAPGGRLYLQVPLLQGLTARPEVPEFHGDDTPVEWRFGPDMTQRLRRHGFQTRLLCTEGLFRHVEAGTTHWPDPVSEEFDVASLLTGLHIKDLEPVADDTIARKLGFVPSYMFLTWEAIASAE